MDNIDFRKICVLSLDLDDTLWPIMPAINRADEATMNWFKQHAPRVAQNFDIEGIRALRDEVTERFPELAHDLGAQRRLCIRAALSRSGYHPAMTQGAWEIYYHHRLQVELYSDAIDLLERAVANPGNIRLAAVTNGNADLSRIGIGHHFVTCIRAQEVAARKPEPAIWQQLVQRMGVNPEQILHVGDHPLEDAEGARNMGIQAVWLNRSQQEWPLSSPAPSHIQSLQPITQACFGDAAIN